MSLIGGRKFEVNYLTIATRSRWNRLGAARGEAICKDKWLVLVTHATHEGRQDYQQDIHHIELDYDKLTLVDRVVLKTLETWPPLGCIILGLFSSTVWWYLVWTIKSLDPDIIYMERSQCLNLIKRRLKKSLPFIPILPDRSAQAIEQTKHSICDNPTVKVSIVVPVYNGGRYLPEAMESCLCQTYKEIELIVVNDGSTDDTDRIIREYAGRDSRIVVLEHSRNMGLSAALNTGFRRARGEFLTWTSHDNRYSPIAIEVLVRYLCKWKEIDLVYSAYYGMDEEGQVAAEPTYLPPPWKIKKGNVVGPFFMFRRKIWECVGEYRTDRKYVEDYDYWARVYTKGFRMMRIQVPEYYYRRHPGSLTAEAVSRAEDLRKIVIKDYFSSGKREELKGKRGCRRNPGY